MTDDRRPTIDRYLRERDREVDAVAQADHGDDPQPRDREEDEREHLAAEQRDIAR